MTIEETVEAMDLDEVVAYAQKHGIDYDDPSQWLDDMWPEKEDELRTLVIDDMCEREVTYE